MRNILIKRILTPRDFFGASTIFYDEDYLVIHKKEIDKKDKVIDTFYLFEANKVNWNTFKKYYFKK